LARKSTINDVEHFSMFLDCNDDSVYDHWRVDHTTTIALVNRVKPESTKSTTFSNCFEKGSESWGRKECMLFSDIENIAEGFIQDDKVVLKARISVEAVDGMKKIVPYDFSQVHDSDSVTLRIGGENVYVSKGYLATHSPYFDALFFKDFKENSQFQIELKDVSAQEFIEFLHIVYPSNKPITVDSYKYILALADRFQVQMHCIKSFASPEAVKTIESTHEFKKFSDALKIALFKRVLALIKG
ncbi:hypothetical protein PENTCL1PPCAC_3809, partial [Pristionchus entomophagus]